MILAVVEPQPLPIMLLNFLGILGEGEVLFSWLDKAFAGGHENKKIGSRSKIKAMQSYFSVEIKFGSTLG